VTGTSLVGGATADRYALDPLAVPTPPYLSVTSSTPEEDAEQKTRQLRAQVLPPIAANPGSGQSTPGAATQEPPKEANVVLKAPAFDATVNAKTCSGRICSWTVSVTNIGNAAGQASVIASVNPGMPSRTVSLGRLQPGQTATTPVMTFANPAPKVPGKTTSITANYIADVYSPQLNGPDPRLLPALRTKGLDPAGSATLKSLDPAELATVMKALDAMSRTPNFDRNKVIRAAENTVHMGALPELRALVESGRLENPEVLTEKLQNLTFEFDADPAASQPAKDQIGYRREIQIAAEALRKDPKAHVKLDGVERVAGRDYTVDVLVKTVEAGAPKTIAVQAKSVNGTRLVANLKSALKQLNGRGGVSGATGIAEGAPPGSTRVALLYVEPYAGALHAAGRAGLERRLTRERRNLLPDWCVNGVAQADEIVMVDQTGTHRWTKEQFNALLGVTCA